MAWARRILPPVWLLLTLLASAALHRWLPIARVLEPPASWLGWALIAAGVALAVVASGAFRRAGTPVIPFQHSTALVRSGIYRFTRNPMYLGMMLVAGGTGVLLGTIGALVPLPVFAWIIDAGYIRAEERFLAEIFGAEYAQYRAAVRRWL